jgi:hypothetical protein
MNRVPCGVRTTLPSMCICSGGIKTRIIYHDGRDWIIEKRGEDYWSFPLDGEEWIRGFTSALTVEDVTMMFDGEQSIRERNP